MNFDATCRRIFEFWRQVFDHRNSFPKLSDFPGYFNQFCKFSGGATFDMLRSCCFWSKKLQFQKNFGRNFNAVERVMLAPDICEIWQKFYSQILGRRGVGWPPREPPGFQCKKSCAIKALPDYYKKEDERTSFVCVFTKITCVSILFSNLNHVFLHFNENHFSRRNTQKD